MSNPFKKITKNSETSKKEWDNIRIKPEIHSRKCEGCGAPRPKNTDLRACDYCGFTFMDIENEVKSDT